MSYSLGNLNITNHKIFTLLLNSSHFFQFYQKSQEFQYRIRLEDSLNSLIIRIIVMYKNINVVP